MKLLSNWLNPEALKIINHMKVPFGCNLLEGPSLPSSIVKEGSAWDDCECPGKRETNKTNIVLVYDISWIMVGLLADKTRRNPNLEQTWVQVC